MADSFHTFTFKVEMTCEGCSKAVNNILIKHKDQGIKNFDIDLKANKVTVETSLPLETITEILKKSGKKVSEWEN